jgi:hypothetical protein
MKVDTTTKRLTVKVIRDYFNEQGYEARHSFKGLKYASNELAKETNLSPLDLLLLVIENRPIDEAYTHSYGFHTRNGRHLIETFANYYRLFENR